MANKEILKQTFPRSSSFWIKYFSFIQFSSAFQQLTMKHDNDINYLNLFTNYCKFVELIAKKGLSKAHFNGNIVSSKNIRKEVKELGKRNNNRSNSMNPNNPAYKASRDNRSNQLNQNHSEFKGKTSRK